MISNHLCARHKEERQARTAKRLQVGMIFRDARAIKRGEKSKRGPHAWSGLGTKTLLEPIECTAVIPESETGWRCPWCKLGLPQLSLWQDRLSKVAHLNEHHPGETVISALAHSRKTDKEYRKRKYRATALSNDGRRELKDEATKRATEVLKPMGHEIGCLELQPGLRTDANNDGGRPYCQRFCIHCRYTTGHLKRSETKCTGTPMHEIKKWTWTQCRPKPHAVEQWLKHERWPGQISHFFQISAEEWKIRKEMKDKLVESGQMQEMEKIRKNGNASRKKRNELRKALGTWVPQKQKEIRPGMRVPKKEINDAVRARKYASGRFMPKAQRERTYERQTWV